MERFRKYLNRKEKKYTVIILYLTITKYILGDDFDCKILKMLEKEDIFFNNVECYMKNRRIINNGKFYKQIAQNTVKFIKKLG